MSHPDQQPDQQPGEEQPGEGSGEHVHDVDCGWAYFAAGGRARKLRHPIAWSFERSRRERACLVREGHDSTTHRRLRRNGALTFIACLAVAYVALYWVPDFVGWIMVLVVIYLPLRRGAFARAEEAKAYTDGWLEGRQRLSQAMFMPSMRAAIESGDADEDGMVGVDLNVPAMLGAVGFEMARDAEVVLDVRVGSAPDDLSGLRLD